jgi:diphthamide synthase (EF-2-diphthine--ammonia ligase)
MTILVSWSSGKDAAWMLHLLRQQYPGAVRGLLTTTNAAFDRVAMHGVRRTLLDAQARAAELPLHVVPLPWPCSNEDYERLMRAAVEGFVAQGFTHVAFGDLFLEDVRAYRESRLLDTGLTPLFPLWKRADTATLAREMIAGRRFDARLLADLPPGVDPCGERGEFHSFAYAGPMFTTPIRVRAGARVERDGFVFCDLEADPS